MCRRIQTWKTIIRIDEPCNKGNDIVFPATEIFEIREDEAAGLFWLGFWEDGNRDDEHWG